MSLAVSHPKRGKKKRDAVKKTLCLNPDILPKRKKHFPKRNGHYLTNRETYKKQNLEPIRECTNDKFNNP